MPYGKGDPIKEQVLDAFKRRCIRCGRRAEVVHEIEVFRSGGERAYAFDNRAPLCNNCHEWAHSGNTTEKRALLKQMRREVVERYASQSDPC